MILTTNKFIGPITLYENELHSAELKLWPFSHVKGTAELFQPIRPTGRTPKKFNKAGLIPFKLKAAERRYQMLLQATSCFASLSRSWTVKRQRGDRKFSR